MTAVCVLILFCLATVQGGNVQVRLSESDFLSTEASGALDVTILVFDSSNQEFGDIVFNVTALTKQQFGEQGEQLCVNSIALSTSTSTRPADAADFASTSVTCIRHLSSPAEEVTCSFSITQDNILESNEILVVVLSVADDAGNTVTVTDNCAVATITPGTNQGLLRVLDGDRQVTEGNITTVLIRIEKDFVGDFPIILNVQTGGFGVLRGPKQGDDYVFNGGVSNDIVFPANLTTLELPLEIVDDNKIEDVETVRVIFNVEVDVPGLDITIEPSSLTVMISDNEVIRGGFQDNRSAITLTEGETLNVCVERKGFDPNNLERQFSLKIEAPQSFRYFLNPPQNLIAQLDFVSVHCIDVVTFPDTVPEFAYTFQITLVDETLETIPDSVQRQRHIDLNIIEPHTLNITIVDDDGTPNSPLIAKLGVINDNDLAFEWSTREEGGLRPVDCYYGNVTVRGRSNSNTLSTGRETVYEFDLCTSNAPRDVEYIFSEESVESSKEYVIVVCSRNALGINCSQPSIFSLPTVAPPPSTPPLITLDPPTAPVLGLVPGVIVGIVVGVVLALCCCLMLLLLLILFCCSWSREKRYFPQKREKRFAKEQLRRSHDDEEFSDNEEFYEPDIVKTPI